MSEHLSEIPDDPPGRGKTVGGCVYYDSSPAVIEAACAAHWAADWETMSERMRIDQRFRMKSAIRAAIDATCLLAPAQAEGER